MDLLLVTVCSTHGLVQLVHARNIRTVGNISSLTPQQVGLTAAQSPSHNIKHTIASTVLASFPGLHQPHSQASTSLIPRPSPASFPGHYQPHSQAITSRIPRPSPTSFPGHHQPHSQAITSLIPRPSPSSFPGHHHPHSHAITSLILRLHLTI